MPTEEEINAQAIVVTNAVQALADLIDQHVQLALGVGPVVYVKLLHPATCPDKDSPRLPALPPANPEDFGAPKTDVPDVFKKLWEEKPR